MKNIISVGLVLCACVSLLGAQQLPVLYREDFSANTARWQEGNNPYETIAINKGVYSIVRKFAYSDAPLMNKTFVEYKKNFDFEMKVKFSQADPMANIGLIWGSVHGVYTNIAAISANGNYGVFTVSNGSVAKQVEWTPTSEFKPNDWNILEVRRRGSAYSLLVNGTTVQSFTDINCVGLDIGFMLSGRMVADIDYLEIRQDLPPINLAPDHPVNVARQHLGNNVNCEGGDLAPVITAKGSRLYFGRYPWKENVGNPQTQDVYYSDLQKDKSWGPAKNIGSPLNNESSNYVISVTPDENSLVLGNTYFPNGRPKGPGLSISYKTENGWSVPKDIYIDNYYNDNRFAEMCLDPSGLVLIMAIQRRDGYGDKDLYVSFKRDNGTFSRPVNCGPQLNTLGSEMSPFMAADGQTLYFATDGRRGYGNVDIWMTRRLDDTYTNWSEPMNLGPVVNSADWDAYYTVPANGEYAYLCAVNGKDISDIYRVPLTKGVRPNPVVLINGRVLDAKTKKPIAAKVTYEKLTTSKKVGEARSVLPNGTYGLSLPAGDLYGFRAEAEGYYPISDKLDTRTVDSYKELTKDLFLVPVKKDETVVLNNLFFDTGLATLRPESTLEIQRLVEFLRSNINMHIELSGHTDNVGSDSDNLKLSQERVNAVRDALVQQGIVASRLKAVGYGETKPKASNSTEGGKQQNRRVEFKITSI